MPIPARQASPRRCGRIARPLKTWRRKRRKKGKPGTPPGTIRIDPEAPRPRVRVVGYDAENFAEAELSQDSDLISHVGKFRVTWIHVEGLGDENTLRTLATHFGMHRLAVEDVVNTNQRPKADFFAEHLFIVCRLADAPPWPDTEQFSLILGRNFVVSFREKQGPTFETIFERIRNNAGIIRRHGADYLAYALIDTVIDEYYPIIDTDIETLQNMEQEVFFSPERFRLEDLHEMKNHLRTMRRALSPTAKAIDAVMLHSGEFVASETRLYLRDALDHAHDLVDQLDATLDMSRDLSSLYAAFLDNRMNEIMKVLTVFAAIFIPLHFIAGVYGMNFDRAASPWSMPELGMQYGYPAVLALMAAVAFSLLAFFKRKGWIFTKRPQRTERAMQHYKEVTPQQPSDQ